ncbi:MAG: dockerin type I repeat-containing protein [Acutalibacteraceae bacterium]
MKKKLLSAILCAALAAASIVSASAADTDNYTSGASYRYKVLGTTELANDYAGFYRSCSNPEANLYVQFYKNTASTDTRELVYEQPLDFANKTLTKQYLSDQNGYRYLTSWGGNFANKVYPSKAGGTYEKIKVKLSDFSDYFNDNGTYTMNCTRCGNHDYNFSDEGNGFSSSLIILSGGIFSLVSPDSSGYVEFYISTKLGEDTVFMTDFSHSVSGHRSTGGGTVGRDFRGLTIGDVDKNGYVSLNDAIFIQKYQLGMVETIDELSKRNADANRDGVINLKDTIKVQKYNLKIE